MHKYISLLTFTFLSFSILPGASYASLSFEDYRGLTSTEEYVRTWAPKISKEELAPLTTVLDNLKGEGNTPILEDNPPTFMDNIGRNLFESGYSYAPIWEIQGPLLAAMRRAPGNSIDIGPGSGNDTISMIAANPKSHIFSVEIHKKQKAELVQRVARHLGEKLGKRFKPFCYDFSIERPVPKGYCGKFKILNLNKVPHFLDKKKTKTMFKNAATLLENDGLLFTTICTPPFWAIEAFNERKAQTKNAPGPLYYDAVKGIFPSYEVLPRNQTGLPTTPGHKIERFERREFGIVNIIRQGRHYHDIETLSPYLLPHFDILDSTTVTTPDGEGFLSVIARKKS